MEKEYFVVAVIVLMSIANGNVPGIDRVRANLNMMKNNENKLPVGYDAMLKDLSSKKMRAKVFETIFETDYIDHVRRIWTQL